MVRCTVGFAFSELCKDRTAYVVNKQKAKSKDLFYHSWPLGAVKLTPIPLLNSVFRKMRWIKMINSEYRSTEG